MRSRRHQHTSHRPAGRARLLDRLAAAAERRTTPARAFTLVAAVAVITATVLLVAAGPPLITGDYVKIARDTTAAAGEGSLVPQALNREVPQPMAAAPQRSPVPADGPGAGPDGEFATWAVLDRNSGGITGSEPMGTTSTTASMIKAWLVADYLRRADEAGEQPSQARLDQLTLIIRDSDNEHTQTLFQELGEHASIERLISICGLTDSHAVPHYWSNTQLSARDTARMGACLADGRGAGPEWTGWLLDEMRQVRGAGDFGIRQALPSGQRSSVAIKNGWVIRTEEDRWHVSCLAIADNWTMGVLTQYPAELGSEHGAEVCRSLAEQHLPG